MVAEEAGKDIVENYVPASYLWAMEDMTRKSKPTEVVGNLTTLTI